MHQGLYKYIHRMLVSVFVTRWKPIVVGRVVMVTGKYFALNLSSAFELLLRHVDVMVFFPYRWKHRYRQGNGEGKYAVL